VNLGHAHEVVLSQSDESFYTGYTIYADSYFYRSDLALSLSLSCTRAHTHTHNGGTVWGNRSPEERGKTRWVH